MDYLAKKAFSSKVNGLTGDAKASFGMDGKKDDNNKNAKARAALEQERGERKAKLEKKQAKRNEKRSGDREAMRAKYAVKSGGGKDDYAGGDDGERPSFYHGDESNKGGCCIIL